MMYMPCNPSTAETGDTEFTGEIHHTVSLMSAWIIKDLVPKNKDNQKALLTFHFGNM